MIHYSFIGYMIASAIIMIVCVIAYRLLLENKINPSTNRLFLLFIYAVSFLFPLFVAIIPESNNEAGLEIGKLEMDGVVGSINEGEEDKTSQLPMILLLLSKIYFLGLFITFLFIVLTVGHLFFLLRKSRIRVFAGTEVYVHSNKKLSSFSWCNKIFLYDKSFNLDYKELQILVSHEKAHLDKGHWIDLIVAQIVLIFQWFNPAAWFMRKELQRIHEYEADESVLKSGIEEKDYQMLLIQNISGSRYSGLTDGLNNCSLKKRIIMMKKTKFKKDWASRGLAVCGFAVLGGLIIHIPSMAQVLVTPSQSTKSETKMIVTKGEEKVQQDEKDVDYYVDGLKTQKDNLASINPANIKAMAIDKSSEVTNVNIKTKPAVDKGDIGNKDFSGDKKEGTLENYPEAYLSVDKMAEYEGGQSQLLKDLIETIHYPEDAKEQKIQGRVVVRFQINTNGTLSNCEVAYSQNSILNEAALKAVENLPGKWEPAEVDGKPVASVFNMPVTFKLQ